MPEMTFKEAARKIKAADLEAKWVEEMAREFGFEGRESEMAWTLPDAKKPRAVELAIEILLQER